MANKIIDDKLLDILACPACKSDIKLAGNKIVCEKCGRKYPIKGGVPVMLLEEVHEENPGHPRA